MRNIELCVKIEFKSIETAIFMERPTSESLVAMDTTPGWPGQYVLNGYHIKDTAWGIYPPGPVWEGQFINDTLVLGGSPSLKSCDVIVVSI